MLTEKERYIKEIIKDWLNDCETFCVMSEDRPTVVAIQKGATCTDQVDLFEEDTWENLFTECFKDAIEDYADGDYELLSSYFDKEEILFMQTNFGMFGGL